MTGLLLCMVALASSLPGEEAFAAGWLAEHLNRHAEALPHYQQAEQDPGLAPYARIQQARIAWRLGQTQAAEQSFRRVLETHAEGPWVRMAQAHLGKLLLELGRSEEAASLLHNATNVRPQPWWMEEFAWAGAVAMTKVPALHAEAMTYFRHMVLDTIYHQKRIEASRYLLTSSSFDDRAVAVNGLLRSNAATEASKNLLACTMSLFAQQGTTLPVTDLMDLLAPAGGPGPTATQAHETLLATGLDEAWVRVWLAHAARTLATGKAQSQSLRLMYLLAEKYPESLEAGDTLWWMAGRVKDQDPALAISLYQRLAEGCPKHHRADDAYFEGALLLETAGRKDEAERWLLDLARIFPTSRFRSEGLYHAAEIEFQAGRREKARELFAASAGNKVGDFHAHRSLDRLHTLGLESLQHAANLRVDGTNSILRAFPLDVAPPRPQPAFLAQNARIQRLVFFGHHGIDAGEWEALDILVQLPRELHPGIYYRAVAEAGFAHTALQFASARGWGMQDGQPTVERLRLEFPLAYWPLVTAISRETGVDPYLVLSVAKQESTFRASVQSHAGATGVMQLMPGTAGWLAQVDSNITAQHAANLKNPVNSLRLGTYYLMRMIDRSGQNLVWAAASYNAGPGNNDKWRKRFPHLGIDAYIEAIPFSETKNYVKRVLGNYAAYRTLYPEPDLLARAMD